MKYENNHETKFKSKIKQHSILKNQKKKQNGAKL